MIYPQTKKTGIYSSTNPLNNTFANRLPEVKNVISVFKVWHVFLSEKIIETHSGDFIVNYSPTYVPVLNCDDQIFHFISGAGVNAVAEITKAFAHLKQKKIVLCSFEYGHYVEKNIQYYNTFPVQLPKPRYNNVAR